jgi:DNA-binding MarR family transcriptional regulator
MDDLGLVRRERLAHDQRRVSVSLTAKSRALAAAMAPRIEAAYRALEERIGKGLIERMYATLDEAIGRLGEVPAADETDEA